MATDLIGLAVNSVKLGDSGVHSNLSLGLGSPDIGPNRSRVNHCLKPKLIGLGQWVKGPSPFFSFFLYFSPHTLEITFSPIDCLTNLSLGLHYVDPCPLFLFFSLLACSSSFVFNFLLSFFVGQQLVALWTGQQRCRRRRNEGWNDAGLGS